jgi:hypothetical protein
MRGFYNQVEKLGVKFGTVQSADGNYKVATKEAKILKSMNEGLKVEFRPSTYSNDHDHSYSERSQQYNSSVTDGQQNGSKVSP